MHNGIISPKEAGRVLWTLGQDWTKPADTIPRKGQMVPQGLGTFHSSSFSSLSPQPLWGLPTQRPSLRCTKLMLPCCSLCHWDSGKWDPTAPRGVVPIPQSRAPFTTRLWKRRQLNELSASQVVPLYLRPERARWELAAHHPAICSCCRPAHIPAVPGSHKKRLSLHLPPLAFSLCSKNKKHLYLLIYFCGGGHFFFALTPRKSIN